MIEIVPYRPEWASEFEGLGATMRAALGDLAVAIHHIGSTSVPGLAAKDVIDIQLTLENLDAPIEQPLRSVGFLVREGVFGDHCPPGMHLDPAELKKRYYRYSGRAVHLHVRETGRLNQQYPLLCRDYLRSIPSPRQPTPRSSGSSRGASQLTRRRITTSRIPCSTS